MDLDFQQNVIFFLSPPIQKCTSCCSCWSWQKVRQKQIKSNNKMKFKKILKAKKANQSGSRFAWRYFYFTSKQADILLTTHFKLSTPEKKFKQTARLLHKIHLLVKWSEFSVGWSEEKCQRGTMLIIKQAAETFLACLLGSYRFVSPVMTCFTHKTEIKAAG